MRVSDVMNHPAVTCPVDAALDAAARLMWEFDCGMVLAVDDAGRLAGVITDRDICLAAYMHRKPLHLVPLAKTMVKPAISVHADDEVLAAEGLMRDNHVRRLPVIDGVGRPVGLISVDDLAQMAVREHRIGADRDLVETLAAVSRPRDAAPRRPHPLVPTGLA
jgi:CBS domain-containing protein